MFAICCYLFYLWLQVQAQQSIVLTSTGEPCFGQTVTLTCTHPDPLQDPARYQPETVAWAENGVRLNFGDSATEERLTVTRLNSTASTLSFTVTEEFHTNRVVNCSCYLTLTGGGREESDPITMDVNEAIQPPTIVSTPNSTSGLLQWRPSSNCSSYQYIFTLTWVRIGDGSTGTVITEENKYDFTQSGRPGGEYTVTITAAIVGLSLEGSEPSNISTFTVPMTGDDTMVIVIVIVIVVIVIVAIIAIAIIVVICCCRNKKKRISQSCSPVTESELGQTGQELDKKQKAENDQVQYAVIDFSGQRPIAPPSLETVVYTETVQQFQNTRENRPALPLPAITKEEEEEEEKKLAQEAAEITPDFKAHVVTILQASKLVYHSLDPGDPVVGTYRGKTFAPSFFHAPGGKKNSASEVDAIIKTRELQSTDKGLLVATTDSISGPGLKLQEPEAQLPLHRPVL